MATVMGAALPAVRRSMRHTRGHHAVVALALVAVAYVLTQVVVGALRAPMDLDEAVYASQFAEVPRIPYAAHRSFGEQLLAAPVTMLTSSVLVIRAYFAVLSGVLLFLAYWPWVRVLGGLVAPVAAALFAFTWVALRFGDVVLPNLPVALGAVAAAGLVVHPGRRTWAGLLVVFAGLSLLRPTDAVWIALPLLAALLVVPAWRHRATVAAILAGMAVGGLVWVVEAYARFGDPFVRLAAVGSVNDVKGGLRFSLVRHLEALSGKESCLPSAVTCGPITFPSLLWWLGGLALVVAGLAIARSRKALMLCVATAAVAGFPYVVLSDWGVPRYLMPVYALLAVPAAAGLVRAKGWVAVGLGLALVAHVGFQVVAADRAVSDSRRALGWPVKAAEALGEHGINGDCVVLGKFAPQIAFLRHCQAADMHDGLGPRDSSGAITAANIARLTAEGLRIVAITARPLAILDTWEVLEIPQSRGPRLYVSP